MDKQWMQEILETYIEGMGASQNKLYIGFVKDFLEFASDMDRDNVIRYTEHLKEAGYAAGSIELRQRTIRSCFKRNDIPWPLKRGENATIPASEERALAIAPRVIEEMVRGALDGKTNILDAWLLALSTTYGVRAQEMSPIGVHQIDIANRSIYVSTLKHGRERYHHIPNEILPVVTQAMPHLKRVTPRFVTDSFRRIEEACGIEHVPETGFHSIRRSLVYYLLENGCTEFAVHDFMRWQRSRQSMTGRYHDIKFVGVDGGLDIGQSRVQDMAIFEKHPFLKFWRGGEVHAESSARVR